MDVYARLVAEASSDRIAAVAAVALSQYGAAVDCPRYTAALDHAVRTEPPPFGTQQYADLYEDASRDGQWMAVSLITNAEREGDGAKRLWSLAACSHLETEKQLLKRHAVDESQHAQMYLALLDLTFPGAATPSFRRELQTLSPRFTMARELYPVEGSPYAKEPTIDDFVQMNIAEIRTTIHHLMQRVALHAHCPRESLPQITQILESLLRDELKHVAYTAVLIEGIAQELEPQRLPALLAKRLRDFNQITTEELDNMVFDCSMACCAKRSWCRAKAPAAVLAAPN